MQRPPITKSPPRDPVAIKCGNLLEAERQLQEIFINHPSTNLDSETRHSLSNAERVWKEKTLTIKFVRVTHRKAAEDLLKTLSPVNFSISLNRKELNISESVMTDLWKKYNELSKKSSTDKKSSPHVVLRALGVKSVKSKSSPPTNSTLIESTKTAVDFNDPKLLEIERQYEQSQKDKFSKLIDKMTELRQGGKNISDLVEIIGKAHPLEQILKNLQQKLTELAKQDNDFQSTLHILIGETTSQLSRSSLR